ncbi:MAG TPA: hypothetical protein VFY73_29085 [Ideonella sp.]|uniref:hypothetical protein n=1 Tax=Ideonella sp. TaxID=1929293 RepID=UPI002E365B5B|nr:hypothetical protein [Ideonella sp.]HEX5688093.1 hypothetical protein [Ideonella sp.]
MRATDLLLHNVVECISIWQGNSFDDAAKEALWQLLYGDVPDAPKEPAYCLAVEAAETEIRAGAKTLLKIVPIYGATVTILTESFHFGAVDHAGPLPMPDAS